MSIQLRKEQNDYIDKILSKGLDEIKIIPSLELSTILNSSNLENNIDNLIGNKINNIHNNKQIIENALKNTQKNLNKLNKNINGNSITSYQYEYSDISSSTKQLIDKYDDLNLNENSKQSTINNKNILKELNNSLLGNSYNNLSKTSSYNERKNNDIMNIQELKINNNNKYNPKSSALKKLIEKLKKEDEYNESKNNEIIQISSFADSGLFTLGNSNNIITSEEENIKIKTKKNKGKKRYKSEKIKNKKIRTFDKIMNSNNKYNNFYSKSQKDMNIKKSNSVININNKYNYTMISLPNKNKKYKYFPISSSMALLSFEDNNNNKNKRSNSMNNMNNIYVKKFFKEENIYKIKYLELKKKFEKQREKMKKEKEYLLDIRQKINIYNQKFEKYTELLDFNKTLNEQNFLLINNLKFSDDVRKKQSKLIEVLQNQIRRIKNKKNVNIL